METYLKHYSYYRKIRSVRYIIQRHSLLQTWDQSVHGPNHLNYRYRWYILINMAKNLGSNTLRINLSSMLRIYVFNSFQIANNKLYI